MTGTGADISGGGITRRSLLAGGAALALAAARARAAGAVPRSLRRGLGFGPAGGGWPMPGHDLAATRRAPGPAGSAERWRAEFPGGVPAPAAVAGDTVWAASAQGAVAALSLRDGGERWRVELGTASYGSGEEARQLGFYGGVAVSPAGVLVASDRVRCLDPATGAARWTASPLRTEESDDYFWGAPTVAGDLVLVGSGSGAEQPTARGRLSAYRLADGALAWSTPTVPAGANGGGVIGPASVDPWAGLAYVATGAPYAAVPGANPGTCALLALRLRDGAVLWEDQAHPGNATGFDFNSAPVIVGRFLFATNKDGVYAWDRFRRRRLWQRRLTDPLPGGAATAGPTAGPEGGPIATDGRRLYVLSNDGATYRCLVAALAPATGAVLWEAELPALCFAAPALAGSRLHVAASDGSLTVLDAAAGTVLAGAALGAPSAAAPAVSRGRLVVGTGAEPYLPGSALVCLG